MTKIILDKKAIPSLLGVIMAFQIAGAIVGFSTAPGVDGWYQGLQKSPLTPPDYLFGVVWSVLYLFLAIVFWRWVRRPASHEKSHILKLFVGHMVLNWAWSFIFFQLHAMVVAFIAILLILITALYLA